MSAFVRPTVKTPTFALHCDMRQRKSWRRQTLFRSFCRLLLMFNVALFESVSTFHWNEWNCHFFLCSGWFQYRFWESVSIKSLSVCFADGGLTVYIQVVLQSSCLTTSGGITAERVWKQGCDEWCRLFFINLLCFRFFSLFHKTVKTVHHDFIKDSRFSSLKQRKAAICHVYKAGLSDGSCCWSSAAKCQKFVQLSVQLSQTPRSLSPLISCFSPLKWCNWPKH